MRFLALLLALAASLAAAADAVTIDTSAMGIEEVFAEALRLIGTRRPRA